jgi:hypothetical protein
MDDPITAPIAPIRLRRVCERNRLERLFLINAYESLVTLITIPEHDNATHNDAVPKEKSRDERAQHAKLGASRMAEPQFRTGTEKREGGGEGLGAGETGVSGAPAP